MFSSVARRQERRSRASKLVTRGVAFASRRSGQELQKKNGDTNREYKQKHYGGAHLRAVERATGRASRGAAAATADAAAAVCCSMIIYTCIHVYYILAKKLVHFLRKYNFFQEDQLFASNT